MEDGGNGGEGCADVVPLEIGALGFEQCLQRTQLRFRQPDDPRERYLRRRIRVCEIFQRQIKRKAHETLGGRGAADRRREVQSEHRRRARLRHCKLLLAETGPQDLLLLGDGRVAVVLFLAHLFSKNCKWSENSKAESSSAN